MSALKRNGKALVMVAVATVFATGSWWYLAPIAQNVGQVNPPAATPVTAAEHAALWDLLDAVDLDRDALVALNLNAAQAEGVFTALRTWYDTSRDSVEHRQAMVTKQLAAVRQLERDVRAGTAEPEALTSARQALTAARAATNDQLDGLRTALASELSDSQRATWNTIHSGWGQAMPLRMVALTATQKQAYSRALRQHRRAMAAATTDDERAAAETAWQAAQQSILTQDNLQVISAYDDYASTAADALAQAENDVMPLAGDVG